MPRVETVKPQTFGGHGVQHRRLHHRVSVVAGFLPPVIVTHHQNDIRAVISGRAQSFWIGTGVRRARRRH